MSIQIFLKQGIFRGTRNIQLFYGVDKFWTDIRKSFGPIPWESPSEYKIVIADYKQIHDNEL